MKHKRCIKLVSVMAVCVAFCLACVFSACESSAKVTGISIRGSDEGIAANVGDTVKLNAVVEMSDGSKYGGNVDWSMDREGVLEQSADDAGGVFIAKSEGEVNITASVPDTKYTASCVVAVTKPATVFTVGVKDDVERFGYRDPKTGEYSGFEIDLAKMLGGALGYDEVKLVPVTPEEREDKLSDGAVDCVIATYTITYDRQQVVNFSDPYYTDCVRALKRASYGDSKAEGKTLSCESLSDITDYVISAATPCRVGTAEGSTAYESFTRYCEDNYVLMSNPGNGTNYYENVEYADYRACEKALAAGEIDLFIADGSILLSHTPEGATILSDNLEEQPYGVATARGDVDEGEDAETELTKAVNEQISAWLEDGTIAALLAEWEIA